MKRFFSWSIHQGPTGLGTLLTGLGTILIGIVGIVALYGTNEILDKILRVQVTTENIENAVGLLREQIKSMKAAQIVEQSKSLMTPEPTRKEIQNALKVVPATPPDKGYSIYLPYGERDLVIQELSETRDPAVRKMILEQYLELNPIPKHPLPNKKP